MPKVFICYRREDSAYPAHQIYAELTNHFGPESVIFDVDTIPLGTDFREYLDKQVSKCDILLAVMGDQWIEILRQRLDDPNDFVRIEIQAALEMGIPVVPILVGRASVPSENNLPQELKGLAYRHAAEVRAGPDLQNHLRRLIGGLECLLTEQESVRKVEEERRKAEAKRKTEEEKLKRAEAEAARKVEGERKRKEAKEAAEQTKEEIKARPVKKKSPIIHPKTSHEKWLDGRPSPKESVGIETPEAISHPKKELTIKKTLIYLINIFALAVVGLLAGVWWWYFMLRVIAGTTPIICGAFIIFSAIKLSKKGHEHRKILHVTIIVISSIVGLLAGIWWWPLLLRVIAGTTPIICGAFIIFSAIKLSKKGHENRKTLHITIIVISSIVGLLAGIWWWPFLLKAIVGATPIICGSLIAFLLFQLTYSS